jgi:hypothetical protein
LAQIKTGYKFSENMRNSVPKLMTKLPVTKPYVKTSFVTPEKTFSTRPSVFAQAKLGLQNPHEYRPFEWPIQGGFCPPKN